jgi:hypothetical protein
MMYWYGPNGWGIAVMALSMVVFLGVGDRRCCAAGAVSELRSARAGTAGPGG